MDKALLKNVVDIINDHRTWITAVYSPELTPYIVTRGNVQCQVYSASLRLRTYRETPQYAIGQLWIIPEYLLDRSVRKFRACSTEFARHAASGQLTLSEIERLIEESSMGFVHLELDEYSL